MSQDVPPGQPEYLDSREGARYAGDAESPTGRRRTVLIGTVAGLGVVVAGGAAWAAWSFFSTGAQPAEALPASTIGYLSVDLDPSGGQKIEALRALKKFPAFNDEVKIGADDDLRRSLVEWIEDEEDCGLDYADDVQPWIGNRFALAAVDSDGEPAPIAVLQVTDEKAAEDGLKALFEECGSEGDVAWHVADGWALVGETQDVVDQAAADAEKASLADDADFQRWTAESGDSGIVTAYAAPAAGKYIADAYETELLGLDEDPLEAMPGQLQAMLDELDDFQGASATIRFDDGGVELEAAGDIGGELFGADAYGDRAGEAVSGLPEDTTAAYALSVPGGLFGDIWDMVIESDPEAAEVMPRLEAELGIKLPEDLDTLVGEAFAIALRSDADLEASEQAGVGARILGDADEIEAVLSKLRTAARGADEGFLDSDTGDGVVAVGPDVAYRAELVEGGDLGESKTFRKVVEHADDAAAVIYIDFDASDWLADLAEDDDARENLEPLDAFGLTSWLDGDTAHVTLKVTTD